MGLARIDYKRELMCGAHNCKCICEELRMIYDEVHDLPDSGWKTEVTEMLVDAYIMVSKMHERLVYYRSTLGDKFAERRTKLQEIPGTLERLRMRRRRVVE